MFRKKKTHRNFQSNITETESVIGKMKNTGTMKFKLDYPRATFLGKAHAEEVGNS